MTVLPFSFDLLLYSWGHSSLSYLHGSVHMRESFWHILNPRWEGEQGNHMPLDHLLLPSVGLKINFRSQIEAHLEA